MEIGPTTHYMMGGVQVDGDTQMSIGAGLVRGGRMRGGIAWSESAGRQFALRSCWCSASARASTPRSSPRRTGRGSSTKAQVDAAAKTALAPFERGAAGENPFAVQNELQEMMQDLVGIVRIESEMQQALEKIDEAAARAPRRPASRAIANTTPAGTRRSIWTIC